MLQKLNLAPWYADPIYKGFETALTRTNKGFMIAWIQGSAYYKTGTFFYIYSKLWIPMFV